MTKQDFENVFLNAITHLRQQGFVPYDTGNLKFNSLKGMWTGENEFTIYFDEDVAPYVYKTNERWTKGRNPHENWIDEAYKFLANDIAKQLGGQID